MEGCRILGGRSCGKAAYSTRGVAWRAAGCGPVIADNVTGLKCAKPAESTTACTARDHHARTVGGFPTMYHHHVWLLDRCRNRTSTLDDVHPYRSVPTTRGRAIRGPVIRLNLIVALLVATTSRVVAQAAIEQTETPHEFLKTYFGISDSELNGLALYRPVSRTLDTPDGREVGTLGVIRMRVPADFYVDQLRHIADFKRSKSVLQIGVFGASASVADVQDLTLDPDDIDELERCRPGACGVQLSSEAIRRFQQVAVRNPPNRVTAITRVMREVLVGLVNEYRQVGDRALMVYSDSDRLLSVADEFRTMIATEPAVLRRFPALDEHMRQFPRPPEAGTDDIIYWSKEKLGPRIILSVTHLAITKLAGPGESAFAAASRQLYGSHYFDASLGVTIVLNDSTVVGPGSYLVYVNRSRLDAFGGFLGGLKRAIVRSRARSAMSASLVEARDRVERRFEQRR